MVVAVTSDLFCSVQVITSSLLTTGSFHSPSSAMRAVQFTVLSLGRDAMTQAALKKEV